ncbi:T9SS type A sorting domain-containing protein [Spirosoma jeollabukense]
MKNVLSNYSNLNSTIPNKIHYLWSLSSVHKMVSFSDLFGVLIFVLIFSQISPAQTLPVLPSPDHDKVHNAFITGKVTVNGTGISAMLVKLIKVGTSSQVSYDLTSATGEYTLSGNSGDSYEVRVEYPVDGFTTAYTPSSFIATSGTQSSPSGEIILERVPNTLTNCNVLPKRLTDWTATLNVDKPQPILGNTNTLTKVIVYSSAIAENPTIDVLATTVSTIRNLRIGTEIILSGPGGYSGDIMAEKIFAGPTASQNINLESGSSLNYYNISSGTTSAYTFPGVPPVAYTGTGSVAFNVEAFASKTITTSGGNTSSSEVTQGNAGVCLVYVYNTNPLPVKLISFSASNKDGGPVTLKWTTSLETDSDRFEVQRSNDTKGWEPIGGLKATNSGESISNYVFYDNNPFSSVSYYRLKMIDLDSKFTYSRIVSVNNLIEPSFTVYPNPVVNGVFSFKSIDLTEISQVNISSLDGKLVLSKEKVTESGINTESLSKGLYSVQILLKDGKTYASKLLIK